MHIKSWLFSLTLLVGLFTNVPAQSQYAKALVGCWKATEPAEEDIYITRDGQSIRFKGRPAYTVTLNFKPDNHGSIQWADSAKAQFFSYRLVNSKLIEMQYADKKLWRHTLSISGNKLSLGEYPVPKKPQESIAILYTLTFTKQP